MDEEIPFHLPDSIEGFLSSAHRARPPQSYQITVKKRHWGSFHSSLFGWRCDGVWIDRYKELHGDPTEYFLRLIENVA